MVCLNNFFTSPPTMSSLLVLLSFLTSNAHLAQAQTVYAEEMQQSSSTEMTIKSSESNSSSSSSYGVNTHDPLFIFMCIVYVISTLSAIITNLIVILVYLVGHRAKTDLSIFLINLAIADFLMSTVCMPFTFAQALLKQWIFGDILCPIVLFKQVLTVSLSIYTMVAIGIDRYFAIKCPLQNRVTHKKARFVMMIVWCISISLASVQLFVARTAEIPNGPNSNATTSTAIESNMSTLSQLAQSNYSYTKPATFTSTASALAKASQGSENPIEAEIKASRNVKYFCNEQWQSDTKQRTYTLFNFFAVYLIPVFILGYTYTCIACIIKQTTHPGNADAYRDMHSTKSKNKVVKMLILLVCVFTLCWLPLHMFTLIKDFTKWLDDWPDAIWFFYSAHWLAMANCTINPIIYGYSSKNFRSDVYSLILCCKCLTRREWMRQESSKTTSLLFKRLPKSTKLGYFNNNLNLGMSVNASFLKSATPRQQGVQQKRYYQNGRINR